MGTKILESTGMVVYNAHNGAEAVNIFTAENGRFDLILMDIRMPIMNGLEAARRIRSLSLASARKVPIVALTVNAFEEDIEMSLDAGMNEHLIKPIEPAQLYHVLEELLTD
ncbi:MAG: response regulator [Blautia sp.]|nr:response regulator [Blautia sp.]